MLFQARRCFNVAAGAFTPQPKVVSTVIAARPLPPPLPDVDEFYGFVKQCFAERRKTLWNNLAPHFDKKILLATAASSGLPATARAEQLPPGRFPRAFRRLHRLTLTRAEEPGRIGIMQAVNSMEPTSGK